MTKSEREFLDRVARRAREFKVWLKQTLCWHKLRDEHDIRTQEWGHVMEDKYTCVKCRAVVWIRRKMYVNGSWIK
jgi:hypothetical protein